MELALMQTCLLVHGCCRHQLHLPQMVFLILSNSHSRKGLPSSTLYRHLQVWNRQVRKWAVASCKQLITIILFRVLLPISQFQSLKLSNLQRSVPVSVWFADTRLGSSDKKVSHSAAAVGEIHGENFGISCVSPSMSILSAIGLTVDGRPVGVSCSNSSTP